MDRSKLVVRGLLVIYLLAGLLVGLTTASYHKAQAEPLQQATDTDTATSTATPTPACSGNTIAQWDFTGNQSTPSVGNGQLVPTDVTGPTYITGNPDPAIGFANWSTAGTIDTSQYYVEFDVSTSGRSSINFSFDYSMASTGPQLLDVYYYINGANPTKLTSTPIPASSSWTTASFTSISGLDNQTNVEFRLYGYAASNNAGTLGFDNVTITGTCTPPTNTPTPTHTSTPTRAATPTNTPHPAYQSILINEVAWMGTKHDPADQWIELCNVTNNDIILSEYDSSQNEHPWILSGTGGTIGTNGILELTGTIPAHGYYVIAKSNTIFQNPASVHMIIQVDGNLNLSTYGEALHLINPTGVLVDTADYSNSKWPAGTTSNRASMERRGVVPDSSTAWVTFNGTAPNIIYDPDGKVVNGTPGQQNWATTVTLTPTPVKTPTKKPTPRPPTPFAHMVINEFLPRAGFDWNNDGKIDVYDEFIELENLGPIDVDLRNWKLDDIPNGGSNPYTLPSLKLKPGQRALYYGSTTHILLLDSGNTVRLINPSGVVVDARSYGPVLEPDQSHCRIPDGAGYWTHPCFPTPGNENVLTGSLPAPPSGAASQPPPCLFADTVPQVFQQAECEPFGSGILNPGFWDDQAGQKEYPVPDDFSKWHSLVE